MANNSPILRVNSNTVLTINNKIIEVDTNLNSVILTIPLVTNDTYELNVIDIQGNAATNNIVITVQSPYTINGMASITLNTEYANATITYDGNGNYAATIHDNGSGGGADVTADNGLNFTGGNPNNITLGGALTNNTDIDTLDFRFKVEGTDPGFGFNQGLSINANINQAQLFSTTQGSLIGWDSGLNKLMIQSGSLENVTITNDGTNNVVLDPNSYNVTHNNAIYHTFNDGLGLASQFGIDNAELALSYTNFSTGSSATQSIGQGSWNAGYQNANISTAVLDDNRAQLQFQNGGSSEISRVLLETNQVTIENTDGISTASTVSSASSGVVQTIINHTTNDYTRIRVLNSGIDLDANINGGNNSTLSVNPDIIFASGGMGYGFTLLSGSMPTTLPSKFTFYFVNGVPGPGTYNFTIPVENCIAGYVMTVKDSNGNAATKNITIDTASGQMESGIAQLIKTAYGYMTFVFDGSTWLTIAER